MKNKLKNQRGETIVEVIVSFMLLLLFTAMFVVSLRYARAMALKAETLRETAYAYCAGLYPTQNTATDWQPDKEGLSFSFKADGAGAGVGTFTIGGVKLQKVDTEAEVSENGAAATKQTHTFHRYYKATGEGTS